MNRTRNFIKSKYKPIIIVSIVIAVCIFGVVNIRGYSTYDNVNNRKAVEKLEYNMEELTGQLENMQDYMNTLERSVNESYYALSMSEDDYDKGMAGELLKVLDTIHINQKIVGDMLTSIHENTNISTEQYTEYYSNINQVYMDIAEVNIVTGNIVNNIDARIDNYKDIDAMNYENVINQTEMIKKYSDNKMQGSVANINNQITNVGGKATQGHSAEKVDLEAYDKAIKENHESLMTQEKLNGENLVVAINNCYTTVNQKAIDNKDLFLTELSNKTTLLTNSLTDLENLVQNNKGMIADTINAKNTSHNPGTYSTIDGSTSYEFSQLQKGILHIPYQVVIAGQTGNTKLKLHHHTNGSNEAVNTEYVYSESCPEGCFTTPAGHAHNASCTYEEINGVRVYTCGFPTNIWKAGCGCYDGQVLESYTRWDYKSEGTKGVITTEP